jgi:hypothetical protein
VEEDVADGGRIGDEGDDPHLGATERAHQRKSFLDASEQHGPGVTGGATISRFDGRRLGRRCARSRLHNSPACEPSDVTLTFCATADVAHAASATSSMRTSSIVLIIYG